MRLAIGKKRILETVNGRWSNRTSTFPRASSAREQGGKGRKRLTECKTPNNRQRPTDTDKPETRGAGKPICECLDGLEATYYEDRTGADDGHG